ncbi:MAG TPA: hypothetical protein VFY39_09770 [Gammaproteobacteria bacterium]|nr:hypothetical protein [Gammaproteobacteria bacterium]
MANDVPDAAADDLTDADLFRAALRSERREAEQAEAGDEDREADREAGNIDCGIHLLRVRTAQRNVQEVCLKYRRRGSLSLQYA